MRRLAVWVLMGYTSASLIGSLVGVATAIAVPVRAYQSLMHVLMHVPAHTTVTAMDAIVKSAVAAVVLQHVAFSLAGAVVVAVALSYIIARRIDAAIALVVETAAVLASGQRPRLIDENAVPVAELADLVRHINHLASALAQAEEERRLAVASIVHELRNPVMTLRAYADGVHDGVVPWDAGTLERMSGSIHRLERLTTDLATLAASEASRALRVNLETVDPALAVAAVRAWAEPEATARGIKLVSWVADTGPLRADPDRLLQILDNLVRNSLTYTPPGGTITLAVEPDKNGITFRVEDTGAGIDPEDLAHVDEAFYRGRRADPTSGMGLGLAVAQRLAAAMGGQIVVRSPGANRGTVALLTFPNERSDK